MAVCAALLYLVFSPHAAHSQTRDQLRKFDQLLLSGQTKEAQILLAEISRDAPASADNMFLSGRLYASQKNYRLAQLFVAQAIEKMKMPAYEHWFLLGDIQQKSNLFSEALQAYETALAFGKNRVEIQNRIRQCRFAEKLKSNPLEVRIFNPGAGINTAADEFRPVVSPDFSELFFNRTESGKNLALRSQAAHNSWEKPELLPLKIQDNFIFSGMSSDGNSLILETASGRGDLYFSEKENGTWQSPVSFIGNSPKSKESSASFSPDGKYIFFISDRSGNPDVWYCLRNGKVWSKPVKAGPEVNSSFAEESPWLDADGQYLYFSSRGHDGIGGFDIFKVPFNRKSARPENIGYPINSPADDLYFMLMPDEKTAFYSSNRDGGEGGSDVLAVKMGMSANAQLILFKGSIIDSYGSPLEGNIVITEAGQVNPLAKLKSNRETGTFVTLLPSGKAYSLLVEKEGYLFHSDYLNFQDADRREKDQERKIRLQKLVPGTALILQNIFFDPGKSSLRKESSPELQRLLLILRQNPGIRAEIAGHIEAGGPEDILVKLTENRAQAVVDYLVATGIKSTRLVARGYGSSKSDQGKAGDASGARTEFRVLSIQ